nr:type II toxin-antitoxin system RelE/ParE family toxin [uncultured Brumimicrobium sp.]
MKKNFEVEFLEDAVTFLEELNDKARSKIYYNIRKAQHVNDKELFKKLNDNIWEFRTLYNSKSYRLFAFWDKSKNTETVVISTHGILKKTQKTPTKEITKAEKLRTEYLKQNKR